MEHSTPPPSGLERLQAEILTNLVVIPWFLQGKPDLDDEMLMSLSRRVLCFCVLVSCNTEKEAHGLLLRRPIRGRPPCCSSVWRAWVPWCTRYTGFYQSRK